MSDKVTQHRAYETTCASFVARSGMEPDPIVPNERHQWRLVSSAATVAYENVIYLFWFWETDA